jgi:hypothetical protein
MRRTLGLVSMLLLALVATAVAGARHSSISTVTVTVNDKTIRASSTAPASGKTVFVVVNRGKKPHAIEVEGPGVKGIRTPKLAAGARAKVSVTLRPGAYVLSDPIGLGEFNTLYLDVVKATDVTGSGTSSKPETPVELPPMCGYVYNP